LEGDKGFVLDEKSQGLARELARVVKGECAYEEAVGVYTVIAGDGSREESIAVAGDASGLDKNVVVCLSHADSSAMLRARDNLPMTSVPGCFATAAVTGESVTPTSRLMTEIARKMSSARKGSRRPRNVSVICVSRRLFVVQMDTAHRTGGGHA